MSVMNRINNLTGHGRLASYFNCAWTAVKHGATAVMSLLAVWPSASGHRRVRSVFFSALGKSNLELICSNASREKFILSCRDNVISREIFVHGNFEFDKFTVAYEILRSHGLVDKQIDMLVDVGANIGPVCIPAVARGYAARAIAIEAHPINCRLLRANVALNGLERSIKVYETAVGELEGQTLELECSEDNWGDHRISASGIEPSERRACRISVSSTTLDRLVSVDGQGSALIWMDIQGYEGFALRGARALVGAKKPLLLEFWPYAIERTGSYGALKEMISEYKGFYTLAEHDVLHPISRLDGIFQALRQEDESADILVI